MPIDFGKRQTYKKPAQATKPIVNITKGKGLLGKVQETFFNKGWGKLKRKQWRFWPSEASCVGRKGETLGKCIRQSFYHWNYEDVTNPVNEFVMKLAHVGCGVEDYTRKEMAQKGILNNDLDRDTVRKFLVQLDDGETLSGEVDIFVKYGEECAGIEMKTYSNKTDTCVLYPKIKHLLQATLYLYYFTPKQDYFMIYYRPSWLTKWATEEVLFRLDLVEIDGRHHVSVNGEVNRDISVEGIINRYKTIRNVVEEGYLPKREFKASSKDCRECPYKDKCFKDPEGK